MIIIKRPNQRLQMYRSPQNSAKMHDLMRMPPKIKHARSPPLRYPHCIYKGPNNMAEPPDNEQVPSHLSIDLFSTPFLNCVCHGDGAAPAKSYEQSSVYFSPFGTAQLGICAEDCAGGDDDSDLNSYQHLFVLFVQR